MDTHIKYSKTVNPSYQNTINKSIIFNYLKERGPSFGAEIARELRISRPVVSKVLKELNLKSYIVNKGKIDTVSGRRPTIFGINNDLFVIGIDLAKRKIKAATTNFSGELISEYNGIATPSNVEVREIEIINELNNMVKKLLKNKSFKKKNLKAIGIAASAPVSTDTKRILDIPLYGNWRFVDFTRFLGEKFNVPVFVENDVNVSAIAENSFFEKEGIKNAAVLEVSRGVGSGLIIDNRLFKGSHGTSGEIGNLIIKRKNLSFKIKNKGFLEKYSSVESLIKQAIKEINSGKKTQLIDIVKGDLDLISPEDICNAANNGDKLSKELITKMVDYLSIAILDLILIVDPEIIIIGGDICLLPHSDKLFLNPIIENIDYSLPFKTPIIRFSELGSSAGALGISLMAIDNVLVNLFPYSVKN